MKKKKKSEVRGKTIAYPSHSFKDKLIFTKLNFKNLLLCAITFLEIKAIMVISMLELGLRHKSTFDHLACSH